MKQRQWGLLGLALSFVLAGCGSSGGGGSSSETQASCNAYCTTYIAAACPSSIYTSTDDCNTNECAPTTGAPAKCQTALKAYYDCRKTQADICADTGCSQQALAFLSACQ